MPQILFKTADTLYGARKPVISIVILNNVIDVPQTPDYIRGVTNYEENNSVNRYEKIISQNHHDEAIDFEELMKKARRPHTMVNLVLENSVNQNTEFKLTTDPHAARARFK
ncbi:MAG: hypothetical protein MZU97_02150 [Bacillus subtilis]|nr:hypothetical protein [Bacillus subtilis]